MKISTDWLKDFVDLKPPFAEHAQALTEAGLEVETVEKTESGDTVFQIEVTTNRPDWLSHWGVARELAAIHGLAFGKPKLADEKKMSRTPPPGWQVIAKDVAELCPYYTGVLIEGITERKVPEFIKKRLESCGLRSIHLVVDITNYVLLELGQPLHAFDADMLAGQQIMIRRARKNEKLNIISGDALQLHEHDLVIADKEKAIALAGIMGGKETEISDRSRNIFLETAHFYPRCVRDSARRHQINTDSSYRFERRVDPCLVDLARQRALQLIQEYAKPRHVSGVICCGQKPNPVLTSLHLTQEEVSEALGCEVKTNQISAILNRLGLGVKASSNKAWKVTVPSFRSDLIRPIDLVEEIARIYGFNKIPEALPVLSPGVVQMSSLRKTEKKARDILLGVGVSEAITFSLISEQGFGESELKAMVRLRNPLQSGFEWLRPTLVPSLLQVVQKNLRQGADEIALFEIANVFRRGNGKETIEEKKIGIIMCGTLGGGRWLDKSRAATYFDLKGILNLLAAQSEMSVEWKRGDVLSLSASVSENLFCDGVQVGFAGEVSSAWIKNFDIEVPVFYGEIALSALVSEYEAKKSYLEIPKFPAMSRDLSAMVPEATLCETILRDIYATGGELVQEVQLFDLFRGGRVPKGMKSLSFRMICRSSERTLTSVEVDAVYQRIVQVLASKYQAQFQTAGASGTDQ